MRQERIRTPFLHWDRMADITGTAGNRLGFTLQPTDFEPGSDGVPRQNRRPHPGWLSLVGEFVASHGANCMVNQLAGAMG
jgi:hypothetical protein